MPLVQDEGICIRSWDWSETSQVVWVFARGMGLVRALAKGAKRSKGRFSGGVELLTRADMGVILRPNSELGLLTEWNLRQVFAALRRSLAAYHAGLYVADLIAHFVRDHDPHPRLYDATVDCLEALGEPEGIGAAVVRFEWAVLEEAGFGPEIGADVRSGEVLAPGASYLFSPGLGGMLPDDGKEQGGEGSAWRVRATTLEVLRRAAQGREGQGRSDLGEPEAIDRAGRLLGSYIRHVLGVEPPTMRAVLGERLMR